MKIEWWIAVTSAVIAALASITAAYFGYSAQQESSAISRDISRITSTFDVYKEFGRSIIEGKGEEPCRALLLIKAIDDQSGARLVKTEAIAKQFKCEEAEYTKALKKAIGEECLKIRPTQTTLKRLTNAQQVEARNACKDASIPDQFEGPWADDTISFPLKGKVIARTDIWCNCLPVSLAHGFSAEQ
jgi:hypothetical protein